MILIQDIRHETAVDLDPQLAAVPTCLTGPSTMQEKCALDCHFTFNSGLAKALLLTPKHRKMLSSSCKKGSGDED